jgi:myo-inositol-1(or 4)-monophosphatase
MPLVRSGSLAPASERDAELRTALAAVDAAAGMARAAFLEAEQGRLGRHRRNGRHDVVTATDARIERRIRSILLADFPMDGFIGEETAPLSARLRDGRPRRTWIVDPIDGTVSFASGIPFFSVSIALAIGPRVVLGVVADPIRGEVFLARAGSAPVLIAGAGRSLEVLLAPADADHPVRVLRPRRLASIRDAVVSLDPGDPDDEVATARVDAIRRFVRAVRTMGSTALSMCWAAAGRLDGVLQVRGLQAVDIAAAGLIARGSGLRVSDADGGRWLDMRRPDHGRGIAAARPALHGVLIAR